MSSKDRQYWLEKAKEKVIFDEKQSNSAVKDIVFLYDEVATELEDKINAMYQKYAIDNNLTLAQANKMLTDQEYSVWRKSIEAYLEDISEGTSSKTLLELNTLAMKSRINREEKLLSDVYMRMGKLAEDSHTDLKKLLSDIVKVNYYKSCFNIQKGIGVGFQVGKISDNAIKSLLDYPWAKKTLSEEVWGNIDTICALTKREITKGFISGASCQRMAKAIDDVMEKGRYAAERLVRTECKYFSNQGELMGYKELGITQYMFLGANETGAHCDCGFYNGKVIDVDKAEAGVNLPPLHPNCKCITRSYFEDSIFDDKYSSKNSKVIDENMSFPDWRKEFTQENKPTKTDFDVETAKEEYQNFLQNVPEKNKIYLDYYSKTTEYMERNDIAVPFGYVPSIDKIVFNTKHPSFNVVDFNNANTHELAHRIDTLYAKSWTNKEFLKAIDTSSKNILRVKDELERASQVDTTGFISDVLSALSINTLRLQAGHSTEYWQKPRAKSLEIFANIFSMESLDDKGLVAIKRYFPDLYKAYSKILD